MKKQDITEFWEIERAFFNVPGVANLIGNQCEYAQTRFRGYNEEIQKLIVYLENSSQQFKSLPVDDEITEVRMWGKNTPELVEQFPTLKATGLRENFRTGEVDVWFSASGFSVLTSFRLGGYFEGHHEGGMGRWAWEYDMLVPVRGSFLSDTGDELEVSYQYPFESKWNDDRYLLEIDGKLLCKNKFEAKDIVTQNNGFGDSILFVDPKTAGSDKNCVIEDGKLLEYRGSDAVIQIPENVVSIVSMVFFENKALRSVHFPGSLRHIGDQAFKWCENLREVVLPDGVRSMGDAVFFGSGVEKVCIPDSVQEIGESVFYGCKISEVQVPESWEEIPNQTFSDCENLKAISLPQKLKTIGYAAFYGCRRLEEIKIPDSVEHISGESFGFCRALKQITLPSSLLFIGNGAFSGCSSLESIKIPESVTTLEEDAFSASGIKELIIPASVEEVLPGLLQNCMHLERVVIEDGIKKIGKNAFSNCPNLKEVIIKGKLKKKAGAKVFDKSPNVVVYGIPGSKAEDLARDNNVQFLSLDSTAI